MIRKTLFSLSALALMSGLVGCTGGGSGSGNGGGYTPTGGLTLDLGADSTPDWSQVVMGIQEVDVSPDGTNWAQLNQPKQTFDLQGLQNGGIINLASNITLDAGTYDVRIIWATTNYANPVNQPAYVVPLTGPGSVLAMPVSTVSAGTVTVQAGQLSQALLMLDTASAVQTFSGSPVFQPSPQLYDTSSCSIAGRIVNGSAAAIPGAEVFAELVDGAGTPHLVRRAITDATGSYRMDGLPSSVSGAAPTYFIVAMPAASSTTAYLARALGSLQPNAGQTLNAGSLAFTSTASTGAIALTLTPQTPSAHGTLADLRQSITIGSLTQYLIVRSDATAVGSSSDTYTFAGLPSSGYGVNATRFVPGGAVTGTAVSGTLVSVSSGATTTLTLTVQ